MSIKIEEVIASNPMLSEILYDAVKNQKRGNGTKVIAVCPTLSREDFIKTLPPDHPARIAQEKKEQGQ
jgi:hypothetical protein